MDAKRWEQVQSIFDAALDRPPAERKAFVREACAGDEPLFDEVMSLLASDDSPHSLLEGFAVDAIGLSEAPSLTGKRIGHYVITEALGIGGMGAVYVAERADGQFDQRVALKLIKRGMDSDAILKRFHAERQILARLDHPNIARLLDGGVSDAGLPFFTMEYVEGERIDEYCDNNRLSIDERLRLFRTVCSAVQYAHNNLVVHRDLKPSNILVTEDGTVKLLDFGIAKVVTEEDGDAESGITRTGARIMTPAYASPEQVRGETVTTASDVYSLGVILYEILAGQRPYGDVDSTPGELEKAISDSVPDKPSRALVKADHATSTTTSEISEKRSAHPQQLRRLLSGDLDNICLMALRKEPERRYNSAAHLMDDIDRHLKGRPVSARPDTVAYRFQKFMRRNRVAVGVAGGVMLVIAAVIGFYTTRLADERDRARLEAEKAAQVSEFLVELFSVADPDESRGEEITARELLDRGALRINEELSEQPAVRSTMLNVIGRVYTGLGSYAAADSLLREALAIRVALHGDNHLDVAESIEQVSRVAYETGNLTLADSLNRRTLEIRRAHLQGDHPQLALSLNDVGWLAYELDSMEVAERYHTEALEMRRRLFGEEHEDVAESLNNLAVVYARTGRIEEAEQLYREALAIRRRVLGEYHRMVSFSLNNLAVVMEDQRRLDEAIELYRGALAIDEKVLGPNHPSLATTCINLARTLGKAGDLDEAERLIRRSLELDRQRGENHQYVAYDYKELARVVHKRGDIEEAERLFREALRIFRVTLPESHAYVVSVKLSLAAVMIEQGKAADAEPIIIESMDAWTAAYGSDFWRVAMARSTLGWCLYSQGKYEEAEAELLVAYDRLLESRGTKEPRTIKAAQRLVMLYEDWGQPTKADPYRAVAATQLEHY